MSRSYPTRVLLNTIPSEVDDYNESTKLSVQITIDKAQQVVIVTFAGEVGDADLLGIAAATKAHPQFNPSFSEIVDFSAVTGGNVSTFALRSLAQRPSIYDRASKHIVIAPQSHVFGLSRMFQVFAENTRPKMAIVHTLNEARNYLALQ